MHDSIRSRRWSRCLSLAAAAIALTLAACGGGGGSPQRTPTPAEVASAASQATTPAEGAHAVRLALACAGLTKDDYFKQTNQSLGFSDFLGELQAHSNQIDANLTFAEAIDSIRASLEMTDTTEQILARLNTECSAAQSQASYPNGPILRMIAAREAGAAFTPVAATSPCHPLYTYLLSSWMYEVAHPASAAVIPPTSRNSYDDCVAAAQAAYDKAVADAEHTRDTENAKTDAFYSKIINALIAEKAKYEQRKRDFPNNPDFWGTDPQQKIDQAAKDRDKEISEHNSNCELQKAIASSQLSSAIAACHDQGGS